MAAYQANIPIRSEIVTSKIDLPLPRFTWTNIERESPVPDLIELRQDVNDYTEQVWLSFKEIYSPYELKRLDIMRILKNNFFPLLPHSHKQYYLTKKEKVNMFNYIAVIECFAINDIFILNLVLLRELKNVCT